MKKTLTVVAAGLLASSAGALELKSADVHNNDDYPPSPPSSTWASCWPRAAAAA